MLTASQDILKTLFADSEMNSQLRLAAVNSINWARILAQITYYFHSYFSLCRQTNTISPNVRFVVPTGNFGDVLAGFFATRMGLPAEKLVVATNENDILHRFWKTGYYEKKAVHGGEAEGGFAADGVEAAADGVKPTPSPAMDILVSSNFERLLWFLAFEDSKHETVDDRRKEAGERVKEWLTQLKTEGGFGVSPAILAAAKVNFASERVSNKETIGTITSIYRQQLPDAGKSHKVNGHSNGVSAPATKGTEHDGHYILDPHSAIGVHAALRSIESTESDLDGEKMHHIALATAHPAKFSAAVEEALSKESGFSFDTVLPDQFVGLEKLENRVDPSGNDWKEVRALVVKEVEKEMGQR